MSGLEPLLPLAWGALRLTSSLVTAGFKKIVGIEDDGGLLTWSGDVVVKARDKSRQGSGPRMSQAFQQHRDETRRGLATLGSDLRSGMGEIGAAVASEQAAVRSDVQEMRHDMANAHSATAAELSGVRSDVRETRQGLATLGSDLRSGMGEIGAAVASRQAAVRSDVQEMRHDMANAHSATAAELSGVRSDVRETRQGLATLGSDLRSGMGEIGAAVASGQAAVRSDIQEMRREAAAELTGIRSHAREVRHDLASVRASVEECRAENMEFFASFMGSIEATQQGIGVLRNGPLEEAEMALKEFQASGGDLDELKDASKKARTALVTGTTLDIKMSAATIVVSSGYVYKSKTESPSEAKHSTVNGTLANIVKHFAPIWADPSSAATADGRKVLSFLINLVSCVSVLPPESAPIFPELDSRLLPAFSQLCAAQPGLLRMYPAVAIVAVKAVLEEKTLKRLIQLADEVTVDVDACTRKEEVIETLLASGKVLEPNAASGDSRAGALQSQSMLELCLLAQDRDIDVSRAKNHVIRILVSSGKDLEPAPDAEKDRAALSALYFSTNGPTWKENRGWGTSDPLNEWFGVTVNGNGRVIGLELENNNLKGSIPSALGQLTAVEVLNLCSNQLSGSIPTALGQLTAVKELHLDSNQLSGSIPAALGQLTAVKKLYLGSNQLSGSIPTALGQLTAVETLSLSRNQLTGSIPTALGQLTAVKELYLYNNKLSGAIPTELGQLTAVWTLQLHNNQLSGPIPSTLSNLTALGYLDLRGNQLTGSQAELYRCIGGRFGRVSRWRY